MSSLAECLQTVGISDAAAEFAGCTSLSDEFALVKKRYFKAVLTAHPDKGGSEEGFRDLQAAFEVLRELCVSDGVPSYVGAGGTFGAGARASGRPQSWEWYAAAAEEAVPAYKAELAKSSRSACQAKAGKACGPSALIDKGEVRVGSLDLEAGGYGRWCHLRCWRVPSRVWLGLPDPALVTDVAQFEAALLAMDAVSLTGLTSLPAEGLRELAEHTMDKARWAKLVKKKGAAPAGGSSASAGAAAPQLQAAKAEAPPAAPPAGAAGPSPLQPAPPPPSASALVAQAAGGRFLAPVPGQNGAQAGSLAGQTVVLTGTFPELGGGCGLTLGKDRAKALVERFGGKVTSAVSGKTTMLLVGKAPGYSKVSKAQSQGARLVPLADLKRELEGGPQLLGGELEIKSFSKGFRGNGIAGQIGVSSMSVPQPAMSAGLLTDADAPVAPAPAGRKRAAPKPKGEPKPKKPKAAPKAKPAPPATAEAWLALSCAGGLGGLQAPALKGYCEAHGLKKAGKKAELVARVAQHIAEGA